MRATAKRSMGSGDIMNKRLIRPAARITAALALVVVLFGGAFTHDLSNPIPAAQAASGTNWQYKTATVASWSDSDLYSSGPALQQLADTGANAVTFTVGWFTDSIYASNVYRTTGTASDDSLIWAIGQAHSLGLQVILKPHLDSQDGQWRANINPSDVDGWFTNYGAMMDHYADLGKQQGAPVLCIGAELISMSTNPAYEGRWRSLIADIRGRFSGKLTYSANWGSGSFAEEFSRIPFWDATDYLGISAYFELANNISPSIADLNASWANWKTTKITPFQQQWGKPLMFTEGGFRSEDGAAMQPWNWSLSGGLNTQTQVDCYESLFESWGNEPGFVGEAFWNWSTDANVSGTNTDYTIQNKPAYNTMTTWFKAQSTPTPTATAIPPTATSIPPTATSIPSTATSIPSTATLIPPTATAIRSATATAVGATKTPTARPIPTATKAPTTAPPTPTATGGKPFTVQYQVPNDWGAGYVVNINLVNNTGAPVNNWTISWKMGHGESLVNYWDANCGINGDTITCTNMTYNATLTPNGGAQSFGAQLSSNGGASYPASYVINGVTVGS